MKMNLWEKNRLEKLNSKKPRTWLRLLVSIFICYQLLVAVVSANGTSYVARSLDSWITPYANLFAFNVSWNFFAPDPAHTMYIQYFVHFDDDQKDPVEGYLPPEKEKIVVDSSKRRFLYAMRFMIVDENRLKIILGPFLCRQYPGASSVHIKNILEPIPNLDSSQVSMGEKTEALIWEHTHDCHAAPDEVAL
jgi:hypothetical protein